MASATSEPSSAAAPAGDDLLAYVPRRSTRVAESSLDNIAKADGDCWTEKIAVCEGVTATGDPQLLIRSYYRNDRTNARVWDEPPSGASHVTFATAEQRKRSELQMQELQLTLDMIPPDDEDTNKNNNDAVNAPTGAAAANENKEKNKKKGLFGRFRVGGGSNKKEKASKRPTVQVSHDLNLQRAIARSMADQRREGMDEPVIYYDPDAPAPAFVSNSKNNYDDDEDEELQLAKAISMSEAAAAEQQHHALPSSSEREEELLLKMALEESRALAEREQAVNSRSSVIGAAKMPSHDSATRDFLGMSDSAVVVGEEGAEFMDNSANVNFNNLPPDFDDDYWNQKMPAQPKATPDSKPLTTPDPSRLGGPSPMAQYSSPSPTSNTMYGSASSLSAVRTASSEPALPPFYSTSAAPTENPFVSSPKSGTQMPPAPAFDPYGPTTTAASPSAAVAEVSTAESIEGILKAPPAIVDSNSLLLDLAPSTEVSTPSAADDEAGLSPAMDEADKPVGSSRSGARRLFGGKKALREEAGLV